MLATLVRLGLSVAMVAGGSMCWGQSRPTTESSETGTGETHAVPGSYWLRVTADRVHLRSRADRNSVPVGVADRDSVLRAVASDFGWHRVVPPTGVFSYVSATYIDQLAHDRGVVSVRSGRLRVRVGSLVAHLDPARAEVQTLLTRGTPVHIVGRDGDWLRIKPPEGVHVFVSSKLVERIDAQVAARLRAQSADRKSSVASSSPPSATQPAEPPNLSGEWGQRLVLVEAAIAAEGRESALEQSWAAILTRLRPIAEQRAEPVVARLAQEWTSRLEQRQADQTALRAARAVLRRDERAQAQFGREMEQIHRARQGPTTSPAFAAQGQLLKSFAAGGHAKRPQYKLHDPVTSRLVAYVKLAPQAEIELAGFVGQYVGVRGQWKHDKSLGADVIHVRHIEILGPQRPTSQPARKNP